MRVFHWNMTPPPTSPTSQRQKWRAGFACEGAAAYMGLTWRATNSLTICSELGARKSGGLISARDRLALSHRRWPSGKPRSRAFCRSAPALCASWLLQSRVAILLLVVGVAPTGNRDAGKFAADATQLPTGCQPESLAKTARRPLAQGNPAAAAYAPRELDDHSFGPEGIASMSAFARAGHRFESEQSLLCQAKNVRARVEKRRICAGRYSQASVDRP